LLERNIYLLARFDLTMRLPLFASKKVRPGAVSSRGFILLAFVGLVLCAGCQSTRPTADSKSSGVMQKQPDNSRDIHGEVGMMYGQGMSRFYITESN
jgi:hypothetical protein